MPCPFESRIVALPDFGFQMRESEATAQHVLLDEISELKRGREKALREGGLAMTIFREQEIRRSKNHQGLIE
jgi:hypothetical protein